MTSADERHPIIAGLVAMVSVTAAVGAVLVVAAVIGGHLLGGSNSTTGATAGVGASMYVPMPRPTLTQSGALLTLPGAPTSTTQSSQSAQPSPSPSHTRSAKPKPQINLTASVVSASSMQLFKISGTYPGGEGHILRLQRKMPGQAWAPFGIPDMDVQGGQFYSSVQTGYSGLNLFRVRDVDTGAVSNVVRVTIG